MRQGRGIVVLPGGRLKFCGAQAVQFILQVANGVGKLGKDQHLFTAHDRALMKLVQGGQLGIFSDVPLATKLNRRWSIDRCPLAIPFPSRL